MPARARRALSAGRRRVHHVFPGGWIWSCELATASRVPVSLPSRAVSTSKDGTGWENCWTACPRCANSSHTPGQRCLHPCREPAVPFRHSGWSQVGAHALRGRVRRSVAFDWLPYSSASSAWPVMKHLTHRSPPETPRDSDAARSGSRGATHRGALPQHGSPAIFNALTLFYFAAASFTESARRLGKPDLAGATFLLGDHPRFAPAFDLCVDLALQRADPTALVKQVLTAIEPDRHRRASDLSRRNSYGVFASDLRDARAN